MGKVLNSVTDMIGLTDYAGEKKAANASAAASAAGTAVAKENLDFQKDQYEDWKSIYGSLQQNLGDYYNSLGADKVAAMGLQAQQQEYQAAVKSIKTNAAARGLDGTTYAQSVEDAATLANASARAGIRATAADVAAQQKLGFLGVGLGQGSNMLANIGNASNTVTGSYMNTAGLQMGRANQLNNTNSQMTRMLTDSALSFAGTKVG